MVRERILFVEVKQLILVFSSYVVLVEMNRYLISCAHWWNPIIKANPYSIQFIFFLAENNNNSNLNVLYIVR